MAILNFNLNLSRGKYHWAVAKILKKHVTLDDWWFQKTPKWELVNVRAIHLFYFHNVGNF